MYAIWDPAIDNLLYFLASRFNAVLGVGKIHTHSMCKHTHSLSAEVARDEAQSVDNMWVLSDDQTIAANQLTMKLNKAAQGHRSTVHLNLCLYVCPCERGYEAVWAVITHIIHCQSKYQDKSDELCSYINLTPETV